jgi:cellulose synthase/poly-beta-1,6-N-acetylglucosamine synthase-like glycosyltransferase
MTHWLAWLLIIYGVATLWLLMGMMRRFPQVAILPSVSVVICVRDEEQHLPNLLKALDELDYPADKLEIVMVDDRSSDATPKLLENFRQSSPFPVVIETLTADVNGFPGKTGALIRGLERASGDIYLLTDADVIPHSGWIRQLVSHFSDDVGLVGGPVRVHGVGLIGRLQTLDWAYMFAVGSGTAGWNVPQSVFGKNAAIRAQTYRDIGTFESVPFSVTEDLALLGAVRDRTSWKIRLPMDKSVLVDAEPVTNVKTFWRQRRRWLMGGVRVAAVGRILMVISLLLSTVIVAGILINPAWALGLLIIMCLLDIPLMASALSRLGRMSQLIFLPLYRVVFVVLFVVISISFLFSRAIYWKGSMHR